MRITPDGVGFITYPEATRQAVNNAAAEWQRFITLPDHVKDAYAASGLQLSVGYERKGSGQRESQDQKENFDLTRAGIEELRQNGNTEAIEGLLAATAQLLDTLAPVADEFAAEMEQHHDIAGFRQTAAGSASGRFIRFLHYPPTSEGTTIGEPHTDHSGYTFHLYESTDGCRGLSPDTQEWFAMPVADGEMAVFGGMQLQLLSDGRIPALCHDIVANSTTSTAGRIAIVCFNMLDGVPRYDRKTHGRLQDKTPGFNYGMDSAEFAKLF